MDVTNYYVLDVSDAAYKEIKSRLEACGYSVAMRHNSGREILNMQNILLRSQDPNDSLTVFLAYQGKKIETNNRG